MYTDGMRKQRQLVLAQRRVEDEEERELRERAEAEGVCGDCGGVGGLHAQACAEQEDQ